MPFLSISSSSHEPRLGIRLATKTCFSRSFGLHQVGARRADELRDDDALGAVDDERAALGHPREVAHEDRLLADLAGLAVDEARPSWSAGARRSGPSRGTPRSVRRGSSKTNSPNCDGEVAGVVLDRRDVVDRLAQPAGVGSVSHSNERRWISMRLGTSRGLFRRAKLRRVRGRRQRARCDS